MKLQGKKVLTVCGMGISRSNTLMIMLKAKGITDSLAVGATFNSPETIDMLFKWADVIIFTTKELNSEVVPEDLRKKIIYFDVGGDRYWNPNRLNPELVEQFEKYLKDYL